MASQDIPFPSGLPAIWKMPARSVYFTGREAEFAKIVSLFSPEMDDGSARIALTALRGMGGIGKTQLAIEYAHREASRYNLVWWIVAEQEASIIEGLAELAMDVGLPPDTNLDTMARRALIYLGRRKDWLVIFDNVPPDPRPVARWLPPGEGHVILTSRSPTIGRIASPIEISEFQRPESIMLLRRRAPMLSEAEANAIAENLGDLPLALEQAGAYIGETGICVEGYLRLLDDSLTLDIALDQETVGHPSAITTIAASYAELTSRDADAASLLEHICFFAPEQIEIAPTGNINDAAKRGLEVGDTATTARIVRSLSILALARASGTTVQLHRIVQSVLRALLSDDKKIGCLHQAAQLLTSADPGDPQDPQNWPTFGWMTPHLSSVWHHASVLDVVLANSFRDLMARAAFYLRVSGQLAEGLRLATETYDILCQQLGPDHRDTLFAANSLGEAQRDLGDYEGATRTHNDTLVRRRRSLGEKHEESLDSASNLALILRSLGRHREARQLNEETLRTRRAVLGASHSSTLISAGNLALDLHDLGMFEQARQLSAETLELRRRVLGDSHPETARSMASLAADLREIGQVSEAEVLDSEALILRERVLGDEHPETLRSRSHVATNFWASGAPEEARVLDERVLEARRRILGENHIDTAKSLSQLARDFASLGDSARSRDLNQEAVGVRQRILGGDSPSVSQSLYWLSLDLRALGDTEAAGQAYERARTMLLASLGEDHSFVRGMLDLGSID